MRFETLLDSMILCNFKQRAGATPPGSKSNAPSETGATPGCPIPRGSCQSREVLHRSTQPKPAKSGNLDIETRLEKLPEIHGKLTGSTFKVYIALISIPLQHKLFTSLFHTVGRSSSSDSIRSLHMDNVCCPLRILEDVPCHRRF